MRVVIVKNLTKAAYGWVTRDGLYINTASIVVICIFVYVYYVCKYFSYQMQIKVFLILLFVVVDC